MPDMLRPQDRGAGFPAREDLLLNPPASAWPGLMRAPSVDGVASETRRALGLPIDRPIVMGGHQPGFWHAGILAKWFAVEAAAARVGGVGAWVVVDQSPGAGSTIEYPATRPATGPATRPTTGERANIEPPAQAGGPAHLIRHEIALGGVDVPPASQKPTRVDPTTDAATAVVSEGLADIARLLAAHVGEPSLARQLHAACAGAIGADATPDSFFASDLHSTPAFTEMVGAMRTDPDACARLYNEAAAGQPGAGVRVLAVGGATVELPLWERASSPAQPGPWRAVTSDRLTDLPDDRVVLRGLPMTGLLRRWACDLFVHGTGGGASHDEAGYDRVTERWLASWLGTTDVASAVVASGTLRVDFSELPGAGDVPTPGVIARARELAHRASHDPSLLGATDLGQRKRALAQQMAALPRGSAERAEVFKQMQSLRADAGRANGGQLDALRARAEELAARAGEAEIVADRAWPFVFHSRSALAGLRERIEAEFGA